MLVAMKSLVRARAVIDKFIEVLLTEGLRGIAGIGVESTVVMKENACANVTSGVELVTSPPLEVFNK